MRNTSNTVTGLLILVLMSTVCWLADEARMTYTGVYWLLAITAGVIALCVIGITLFRMFELFNFREFIYELPGLLLYIVLYAAIGYVATWADGPTMYISLGILIFLALPSMIAIPRAIWFSLKEYF